MNSSHFYGSGSNIGGQYGLAGASNWINPNMQHTKPIRPSFKTTEGHYKLIKDVPVELDQKSLKRVITNRNIAPKVSCYHKASKIYNQTQQQQLLQQQQQSSYNKNNNNNVNITNTTTARNSPSSSMISSTTSSSAMATSTTSTTSTSSIPTSTIASFVPIEEYSSSSLVNNKVINNFNNSINDSCSTGSYGSSSSGSKKNIIHPTSEKDQLYFSFTNYGNLSLYNFTNIDKAEFEDKIHPVHLAYNSICQKIKKLKKNNHLQILVGTDTGEILLIDPQIKPIDIKIFNKENTDKSKCLCVDWLPNSDDKFVAGFDNGNIMIFDTSRSEISSIVSPLSPIPQNSSNNNINNYSNNNSNNQFNSINNVVNSISGKKQDFKFTVINQKDSRLNPTCLWKVSDKKKVNSICFSPDGKYLAAACQEGLLNIYDLDSKIHLISFKSYFGGFLSVDWSADGKYIATGGEDDFISIFSFEEKQLVARGQGHQSWIGCIKFDPYSFSIDSNQYRILSGGEDTRLLLWDFSKDTVMRKQRGKSFSNIKNTNTTSSSNNVNGSGSNNDGNNDKEDSPSLSSVLNKVNELKLNQDNLQASRNSKASSTITSTTTPLIVNSLSRTVAPIILPIVSHRVHTDPITDLLCTKDWIVTVSYKKFSIWARPDTVANAQKADSMMCSPNTPSSFTKQFNSILDY